MSEKAEKKATSRGIQELIEQIREKGVDAGKEDLLLTFPAGFVGAVAFRPGQVLLEFYALEVRLRVFRDALGIAEVARPEQQVVVAHPQQLAAFDQLPSRGVQAKTPLVEIDDFK